MDMARRNRIAQWAFDTRAILGRFHLWLEDVEETWVAVAPVRDLSFVGRSLEASFVMTAAVTALGTRLFGRYGEGKGLDKAGLNRVKKDADAVSAYAMSEALWYLTPGAAGEPRDHGQPRRGADAQGRRDPGDGLEPAARLRSRLRAAPGGALRRPARPPPDQRRRATAGRSSGASYRSPGITVWGAAIDTLENTSRFAKGDRHRADGGAPRLRPAAPGRRCPTRATWGRWCCRGRWSTPRPSARSSSTT